MVFRDTSLYTDAAKRRFARQDAEDTLVVVRKNPHSGVDISHIRELLHRQHGLSLDSVVKTQVI